MLANVATRIRNLTIKTRLAVAFTLLVGVIAIQGALAIHSASRIHQAAVEIQTDWLPSVKELANLRYLGVRHRAIASRHLMLDTDGEKAEVEERLSVIAEEFKQTKSRYLKLIDSDEERALFEIAEAKLNQYFDAIERYVVESRARHTAEATWLYAQVASPISVEAEIGLGKVIALNDAGAAHAEEMANGVFDESKVLVIGSVAIAVLFACVAGWLLIRTIALPITKMTGAMMKLAQHDLAVIIPAVGQRDEIGLMANAVQVFRDNIIKTDEMSAEQARERAAREGEARFRALIEHSSDVYYILRPTGGEIMYRSPSASKAFGYADVDIVGRSILVGLHPDDVETFAAALKPRTGEVPKARQGRARVRHQDGSWRHVIWACSDAISIPGIGGMVLNVRDVTDAVEMEAQLLQAQKMEAVGRLAGGIAHDFNNILGSIMGFSGLLIEDLPAGSEQRGFAQRIAKAGDRGKQLVQQILAFSRHTSVEREPTDLGRVVHDVRELLASSMPSTTRLDVSLGDGELVAEANVGQITQILLNLCINANDALAGGPGSISIELAGVRPGSTDYAAFRGDIAEGSSTTQTVRTSWGSLNSDRPYARIRVADTGLGMDAALLARIFDPFFTTKAAGRGTGLGLSVVHGVVLSYGGAGLATSRAGVGTVFTIYLPLIDAASPKAKSTEPMRRGGGSVLLVDDDPNLADAMAIRLGRLGYEVVTTNDPTEAIEIFTEAPDRWAVVVSDQTMPNMTGLTLYSRLTAIHPGLRFVLCTGFSDGTVEDAARAAGINAVLIKPVPIERLVACIGETADRTTGEMQPVPLRDV